MNNYIALENIRSLLNIGAIFRTCNYFGFYNIILVGYSGVKILPSGKKEIHPKLLKSSLGSENLLNLHFSEDSKDLVKYSKDNNLKIISIEQSPASKSLLDVKNINSSILVFGNEVLGVSTQVMNASKDIIEIPQYGQHNSLNVATSCGVVLSYLRFITN